VAAKALGKTTKTARGAAGAPTGELKGAVSELLGTVGQRVAGKVADRVSSTAERLTDYAAGEGGDLKSALTGATKLAEGKSPARAGLSAGLSKIKDKVKGMFGGGGGKGNKPKLTNIIESIDVGVPLEVAYAQWTRFTEFPRFMKKVENVEQVSDEKLNWKAQIFWSHRSWEAKIVEQVPNDHIVWRSKGEKGHVDGAVTFHELAPRLTRIELVLAYHPQGLFERTGNLWRAQGRRVRLELKHFRRYVMTESILHPDEVEGWPGEIRDGRVDDEPADQAEEHDEDAEETDEASDEADEATDETPDEADEADAEERPRRAAKPRRGTGRSTATKTRKRTGDRQ
jgi:uncharacterized membrane protein